MRKKWLVAGFVVLILLAFPFTSPNTYLVDLVVLIFLYSSLALSWDMIARTGQLSLAHHAFFGIGAYTSVLLNVNYGVDPILGMILGGVAASIASFFIGAITLKLRGLYFAIATLAFAGFIQVAVLQLPEITGGAGGITLTKTLFEGDIIFPYFVAFLILVITVLASLYFFSSSFRYSTTAIATNETVAKSFGIDVPRTILVIFVISSFFPGFVGAFYAHYTAFINPHAGFDVAITLAVLTMTIFGGMGTTFGPVLGATILKIVEEFLRINFVYGHMIVYGIILVVVILYLPKGLVGVLGQKVTTDKL